MNANELIKTSDKICSRKKIIGVFFMKCMLILLPFLFLLVLYVYNDPYMVLRPHQDYDHSYICPDEGAIGWYKYKLYRDKMHYDSFIMGTSCTMAYRCEEWTKYIHGSPYRFYGNGEGLVDLYLKLAALDSQKEQQIKNILLVFEQDLLMKSYMQTSPMCIMPSKVSHVSNYRFQMTFLENFMTPSFLFPYLQYKITHVYSHEMAGIVNPYGIAHIGAMNDAINPNERRIRIEGRLYWKRGIWQDYKYRFCHTYYPQAIGAVQYFYLYRIKEICDKHHTCLKIIVSPNVENMGLNRKDVRILMHLFGKENVFDFSSNRNFSKIHNFYDFGHYRVAVGDQILKIVYGGKNCVH